jgi:hypothetical protein
VLLATSLVFTLLVTEASLRVAFYHSKDFAMEMWKYAVQLKQPVSNPDLGFVHIPNGHAFLMGVDVNINSQGLRDYEYSLAKPPETYRIMTLGDSTTLGWGVPLEATVPKLLERELNPGRAPGIDRFEVLNAGVGNYNTVQEVTYYETIGKAFDPLPGSGDATGRSGSSGLGRPPIPCALYNCANNCYYPRQTPESRHFTPAKFGTGLASTVPGGSNIRRFVRG